MLNQARPYLIRCWATLQTCIYYRIMSLKAFILNNLLLVDIPFSLPWGATTGTSADALTPEGMARV